MKNSILGIVLAIPALSFGAGFAVPEQDARALGAAGTGAANATGGSTVYYNPALAPFEDGAAVDISGVVIVPSFTYEGLSGNDLAKSKAQTFIIPTLFAEVPVSKAIRVGLGVFSNYGLGLAWPSGFTGRFESTAGNITTYTINPSVSVGMGDNFAIGLGVDVVRATVDLERTLAFPDNEGTLELGGATWGLGFNAGLAAKLDSDRLRLGLTWRSYVPLTFHGDAHFQVPREFQALLADQKVSTTLTLPNVISLGASYAADPKTHLTAEVNYTTWSSLHSIDIAFADNDQLNNSQYFNWHDSVTVRMAMDRELVDHLTLRLGLGFDQSPAPSNTLSPALPDSDRLLVSGGLGYRMGAFGIDAGYMYVSLFTRNASGEALGGFYSGRAHVAALTLSFHQ